MLICIMYYDIVRILIENKTEERRNGKKQHTRTITEKPLKIAYFYLINTLFNLILSLYSIY